jgi:hypothetical protein
VSTTSSAEQRITAFFGATCTGTDLYDLVPVPNSTYVLNGKVIELGPGWRLRVLPYPEAFARWLSRQNPAVLAELDKSAAMW